MNKHTADRMQYVGRVGNHSTKPSARGVNLLNWGADESLAPEQKRQAMAARVRQIDDVLRENKRLPSWQRAQLVGEKIALQDSMREIRPTRRAPGVAQFFVGVARERLTKAEFDIWMGEAVRLMEAEQGELPVAKSD